MLNALILEPETTVQVLGACKELCIAFAQAQIEAGADLITVSEDAAGEMISREGYRQLVMDTERQIFQALQGDTFVTFHLSGNIMDRADLFRDTGFHALSFDSRNDLQQLRAMTGNMKLIGGVNNPGTLLNGSREMIAKEVFDALDKGVALVAPECAIPLRVPNRNLQAMHEAVLQYEKKRHHDRRDGGVLSRDRPIPPARSRI
jgi:[methyl-Co(III) methanol-specific corrinoid protein]:coenzyme M methyltransferase